MNHRMHTSIRFSHGHIRYRVHFTRGHSRISFSGWQAVAIVLMITLARDLKVVSRDAWRLGRWIARQIARLSVTTGHYAQGAYLAMRAFYPL